MILPNTLRTASINFTRVTHLKPQHHIQLLHKHSSFGLLDKAPTRIRPLARQSSRAYYFHTNSAKMAKKIITIIGATGGQGGSVAHTFLNDPTLKSEWTVRGVTRDASTDRAKKLAGQGAEVVSANSDDKESLVEAFKGSDVVFSVTNYWDHADMQKEIQQGKNLADAAKEAGVGLYIWSSLLNVDKLSGGVLPNVYHFDSKAIVEDYIREQGIPAAFFMPGFYMSNVPGGMFRPSPPDDAWTLGLPIPSTAQIPMFDAQADSGKFIKGMILAGDAIKGKRVYAATKYMTGDEIVGQFKELFPEAGKTAKYFAMPHETFRSIMKGMGRPDYVVEEMLENNRLMDEFGYFGGEPLDESLALLKDKPTTWVEHMKASKVLKDLK